ncbi:MAG TPA: cation diffusion facilitator family transporter, partial [Spirochaetota bacterium]|nr:cation diffusion facilitator family transporter [Spirochaetota bacterium]
MTIDKQRERYVILVSYITLFGNAALAIMKLTTGFIADSFAVIGDGIDSSTDVVISIISLISTYIASKPADRVHSFGHKRAETIGTKVLSFIIIFAGIKLFTSALGKILKGGAESAPDIVTVIVVIISIFGKLFMSALNFKVGKKIGSDLIIANAK